MSIQQQIYQMAVAAKTASRGMAALSTRAKNRALLRMAEALIAQKETKIESDETARELRLRLIEMGAGLLVATLPDYLSDVITPVPQDHSKASRSRKTKKEEGQLSLNASALENWNKYRAYADSIGTYFFENGKRIKITSATLKNGNFVIERVIPEGKKEMSYSDFSKK